jgi:hypothetical protein
MTQKLCNVILGLGLVVVAALSLSSGGSKMLGGANTYETYPVHFVNGLYGGGSNQFAVSSTGALTLGASGTAVANSMFGTCNITQMVTGSFAATTSAQFF